MQKRADRDRRCPFLKRKNGSKPTAKSFAPTPDATNLQDPRIMGVNRQPYFILRSAGGTGQFDRHPIGGKDIPADVHRN
jgi:hypothetical protein